MAQNLASTHFTAEQWTAVDTAFDTFEAALAPMLLALAPAQRRRLVHMGDGSEAFVRKGAEVAAQNRGLMPGNFDVDEMRRDLESHDALNARYVRLTRLMEKVRDTDIALGSDAMNAALQAYKFLKGAGEGEGVEALKKLLGERFDGNGTRNEETPAPAA